MDEILSKSNINKNALKSLIVKIAATELTKLSEPCYYPEFHKRQYEMFRVTGLTEKELTEFTKRFWKGTKWSKFQITNDKITMFFIFIMNYFLNEKDIKSFEYTLLLFMVRYYTNLMHKQIKYCNPEVFKFALDNINKTHLFSREKTIPNAILFLSRELEKRYKNDILELNKDKVGVFIQMARTRLSQSIKSFAALYYKASEEGTGIRSPFEGSEDDTNAHNLETVAKSDRLIEEITKKITVYKFIDNKAMTDAKNLSKIKTSLAILLSKTVTDMKYSDTIKSIYRLFIKDLKNVNLLCGNRYYTYIKRLMSIKRTNDLIYFKQQVNVLLIKLLKEIKYEDTYNKLTSQSKFNINTYLAYYITMILRNSICDIKS